VNRREDMGALLDSGVDGLITDRPDIAQAVLAARGQKAR
jgi:glycerophosphoryl diester phosphodiesterase